MSHKGTGRHKGRENFPSFYLCVPPCLRSLSTFFPWRALVGNSPVSRRSVRCPHRRCLRPPCGMNRSSSVSRSGSTSTTFSRRPGTCLSSGLTPWSPSMVTCSVPSVSLAQRKALARERLLQLGGYAGELQAHAPHLAPQQLVERAARHHLALVVYDGDAIAQHLDVAEHVAREDTGLARFAARARTISRTCSCVRWGRGRSWARPGFNTSGLVQQRLPEPDAAASCPSRSGRWAGRALA